MVRSLLVLLSLLSVTCFASQIDGELLTVSASSDHLPEEVRLAIERYEPNLDDGLIYISKKQMSLTLYDSQMKVILSFPMACGRNVGAKRRSGDNKTPEGLFSVQQIQPAQTWGHDFHDGKGFIPNAYGPWFIRLKTGFQGIGIHGTHDPSSIGKRATEGCIRLENSNLERLKPLLKVGMTVVIGEEQVVE